MRLNELIAQLEAADPKLIVARGFSTPHSDRGFYENLAFKPAENVTVESMLTNARSALGKIFEGYKGGSYLMNGATEVFLGEYGDCGDPMSADTIEAMLTLADKKSELETLRVLVNEREVELLAVKAQRDALLAGATKRMSVAMPDGRTALAVNEIVQEMLEATANHGPLASPHEGLGVLLEEFEELKDWVKLKEEKRDSLAGRREAMQVAAVALRFMLDCCERKGGIVKDAPVIMSAGCCARAI